jgi:hypothetical protein
MRAGLPLIVLLACDPSTKGEPVTPPATPAAPVASEPAAPVVTPVATPVATSAARRCLPVVAAECGCVYGCGLGTETEAGRWSVAHEAWAPHPVVARVDRWCVDGQCTEAFFGEIVCGGICSPKPAEAGCRLVEDRCEVATPAATAPATAAVASATPVRPIKTWPFDAWDRAEAVTFNHLPYGPGIPLRAYDADHGWSPNIVERRPISQEQAARAVDWVIATGGELEVSKCPFPRHAVVLYAGERPVGTANVCFECGDILVWPDLDAPPDYANWTDQAEKQWNKRLKKKMAGYKKVFPQWERFFRDELGYSLTPQRP